MSERRATIASRAGLHARPAALFAKAAGAAPIRITISKEGKTPVNAASVLSLMTLGAEHGDEVVLCAEGEGAEAALGELTALLERDLDAPD